MILLNHISTKISKIVTVPVLLCLVTSAICKAENASPNFIIFFTDDQGWADLGVQGVYDDLKTPNIDRMAEEGVRFTNGYVTSPQCTPSRAGLLSGQYQNRFGLDDNAFSPLSRDVLLLPERLKRQGYKTGMAGKWHLEINRLSEGWLKAHNPQLEPVPGVEAKLPFDQLIDYFPHARGFTDVYFGYENRWWVNYDLEGSTYEEPRYIENKDYRLDVVSEAALAFIDRHHESPFFLYVPYYAPHVPMDATKKYLDRHMGDMPERRRYCLAMLSAIDDGVGGILKRLEEYNIDENTLIFFLSDNGAPIKMHMEDISISHRGGAWDGSKNGPLNGEKGMLAEGGIRVPFIAHWKSKIPGGQVIDEPVISVDISATMMGLTESGVPGNADGVDLMPLMSREVKSLPERSLYWKFWSQRAVRKGKWKYLEVAQNTEFLFDMDADPGERKNLIKSHPELAKQMKSDLEEWTNGAMYPDRYNAFGFSPGTENQEKGWYKFFFKTDIK